eukprot:scaffold3808_cov112-Isochrysis_galbana.AAC.22
MYHHRHYRLSQASSLSPPGACIPSQRHDMAVACIPDLSRRTPPPPYHRLGTKSTAFASTIPPYKP